MPLRTKKELMALPEYELTLTEWCWCYPDKLAQEHYKLLKVALKAKKQVPDKVLENYPSLRSKKHGK